MIVTNQDKELRANISQRGTGKYNPAEGLNKFVERELVKLIVLLMETIKQMIFQVEELRNFNIDFTELCEAIDNLSLGCIEKSGLSQYLKTHASFFISLSDLGILLNKLDIDRDGVVSYNDLSVFFFLKSRSDDNFEPKDKRKIDITDNERMKGLSSYVPEENDLGQGFINIYEKKKKTIRNIGIINKLLINYMKIVLEHEIKAEGFRKKLCNRDDLVVRHFVYLFPVSKGYITVKQFQQTCEHLKIYVTDQEAESIFIKYDADGDLLLSNDELASIVLSKNEDIAAKIQNRVNDDILSEPAKKQIVEFIRLLLDNEKQIYKAKRAFRRDDIGMDEYFNAICSNMRDYLTIEDVFIDIILDFLLFKERGR
jgi:Ca2+-binding EF-hand superfamily protein